MPEHDAVLFANEAFYLAVNNRDIDAMRSLWADGAVACLHPGWAALLGRTDVLASWERILSHEASPRIVCRAPRVLIHGDVAAVICYEQIERNLLVATNMFRRDGRQWRMIHHQAGPTAARLPADEPTPTAAKPN